MREKILSYLEEIKSTTFDKMDDLESFRVKYIGKKDGFNHFNSMKLNPVKLQ